MPYGTLAADTIQSSTSGTPPQFNDGNGTQVGTLCRAWVNFNGTTSPGTIRASFNVASVTKSATGYYAVNFTNALPDANYSVSGTGSAGQASLVCVSPADASVARTTSAFQIAVATSNGAAYDSSVVNISVFR